MRKITSVGVGFDKEIASALKIRYEKSVLEIGNFNYDHFRPVYHGIHFRKFVNDMKFVLDRRPGAYYG